MTDATAGTGPARRAAALTGLLTGRPGAPADLGPGPAGGSAPAPRSASAPAAAAVSAEEVAAVLRAYGEPDPVAITDDDVASLRPVAQRLRPVFAAPDLGTAARLLNEILAAAAGPPRLSSHDGTAWHLHVDAADDAPWAEWFAATSATALAELLAARQALPGGICAAAGCELPFVRTGGGSAQRYCSPRCATRERVSAHRAGRHRADAP
jgi:predicted RNA-binding Zn ribbon-like protein